MSIDLNCKTFSAAHSPVRLDTETKFPYFLFWTWLSRIKIRNFVSISSLTDKCAAHSVLVYGHVYIILSY